MTPRLPDYVFAGGTAVVTGAASGIGEALAHALAARGSSLVLVDRDARRLAAVVGAIRAEAPSVEVTSQVVDLSDAEAARRLGETLLADCPRITLLVNNAGIALGGRFDQLTLEEFDTVMRVNFTAPLVLTHTLLPALKAAPGSHLVNVSSLFGLIGPAGQSAYSASKFALRGLTEVLRHELPSVGVGVTAVHPGGVRTRIASSARAGSGVPVAEAIRGQREFQRLLTLDPAEAARVIVDGIEHRRPRVLVGWSAKVPDVVARLFPSSYGPVLSALTAATRHRRRLWQRPGRSPRGDARSRSDPRPSRDSSGTFRAMTRLRDQPAVAALLPVGSGRRAAVAALVRRVAPSAARRQPGRRSKSAVREEERQLRRVWARHRPEMLDVYLVSGFQDPRINVQSILGRHTLVRALFGSAYEDLMQAELAWAVELNEAIRLRARELGVSLVATMDPERQAGVQRVMRQFDDRAAEYAERWRQALGGRRARRLRVVELACGSANDYRAMADYGLARFLDYTGIDLNPTNIENAKQHFPHVDFRVGSILALPMPDRSADYVVAFDIFEHLSLEAMHVALDEAVRVSRRGLYLGFFRMADVPEHVAEPRGRYHYNTLSASRIREYLERHYPSVDVVHISGLLRERFEYRNSYNSRAYSVVAERPRPARRLVRRLLAVRGREAAAAR